MTLETINIAYLSISFFLYPVSCPGSNFTTTTNPKMCAPMCQFHDTELTCTGNSTAKYLREILTCVTTYPQITSLVMKIQRLHCTCQWFNFATQVVDQHVRLITTETVQKCLQKGSVVCHPTTVPPGAPKINYGELESAEQKLAATSEQLNLSADWDSIVGDTSDWVAIHKIHEASTERRTYDELKVDDLVYIIIILATLMTPMVCGLAFLVCLQLQKLKNEETKDNEEEKKDEEKEKETSKSKKEGLFKLFKSKKKREKENGEVNEGSNSALFIDSVKSKKSKKVDKEKIDQVNLRNQLKKAQKGIKGKKKEHAKSQNNDTKTSYSRKVNKVFGKAWEKLPTFGTGTFPDVASDDSDPPPPPPLQRNNNSATQEDEFYPEDSESDTCSDQTSSDISAMKRNYSHNNRVRMALSHTNSEVSLLLGDSSDLLLSTPSESPSFISSVQAYSVREEQTSDSFLTKANIPPSAICTDEKRTVEEGKANLECESTMLMTFSETNEELVDCSPCETSLFTVSPVNRQTDDSGWSMTVESEVKPHTHCAASQIQEIGTDSKSASEDPKLSAFYEWREHPPDSSRIVLERQADGVKEQMLKCYISSTKCKLTGPQESSGKMTLRGGYDSLEVGECSCSSLVPHSTRVKEAGPVDKEVESSAEMNFTASSQDYFVVVDEDMNTEDHSRLLHYSASD